MGGPGQGFGPMAGRFGGGFTVSGVSGDTITATVRGTQTITITVTSTTVYTMAGAPATLADIQQGSQIAVRGTGATRTAITATSIEVILPSERGVVTAVSGATLNLTGFDGRSQVVTVNGSTRYQEAGQTASVSNVASGTAIQAEGTTNADGSLSALLVTIQTPRLMGQVTLVQSGTYTITGRVGSGAETVTTSSSTVYVDASGATVQPSTITTGTYITAEGTLSADGKTLGALRITVVPAGSNNHGRSGHFPGRKAPAAGAAATQSPTATPGFSA